MQLQVVTTATSMSGGKRPKEYLDAIEELKKSFIRSIDIVNKLRYLGLKYGHFKEEIRRDIELALEVVKPRQLRSPLPLELKNVNKSRQQPKKPPQKRVAAVAAAKPLPPFIIEFRGKISKMGKRYVICVPTYLPKRTCEKTPG
jgi:hypothetical protein